MRTGGGIQIPANMTEKRGGPKQQKASIDQVWQPAWLQPTALCHQDTNKSGIRVSSLFGVIETYYS